MSAIAHFVFEDYAQGTGITPGSLTSRVGEWIARDDGNTDNRPVISDVYMNRPNGVPAKAGVFTPGIGLLFVSGQTRGNSYIPDPVSSAVRTFEIITRTVQDNRIARCRDNLGNEIEIRINGNADLKVFLSNINEDAVTLSVSGADTGDDCFFHHIVVVVDLSDPSSKTAKLYVDGVFIGEDTQSIDLLPPQWDDAFFTNTVTTVMEAAVGHCETMVHDVELTADDVQRRSFYMRAINAQQT